MLEHVFRLQLEHDLFPQILGALISLLFQIYPFILILFFQSLLDQPNCVAKIISVRNEKKVLLLPMYICFLTKFVLLHCKF
jgi:hypothetical protein